jgi:hypothetical protein
MRYAKLDYSGRGIRLMERNMVGVMEFFASGSCVTVAAAPRSLPMLGPLFSPRGGLPLPCVSALVTVLLAYTPACVSLGIERNLLVWYRRQIGVCRHG